MKTFFRKKCPECGKRSRLVFWQDKKNIYMTCPKCGFEVDWSKTSICTKGDLKNTFSMLHYRWNKYFKEKRMETSLSFIPTQKPVPLNRSLQEGKVKKGGINKPPTTPKPKCEPKGQGKRK